MKRSKASYLCVACFLRCLLFIESFFFKAGKDDDVLLCGSPKHLRRFPWQNGGNLDVGNNIENPTMACHKKGARSGTLKTDPQRLLKSSCVHMFILNAIFLRHALALSHCLSVWRGCGYSPWKLTAGRCLQHLWSYSCKGWVARLCGFLQYWPNHKKHCHPGLQNFGEVSLFPGIHSFAWSVASFSWRLFVWW